MKKIAIIAIAALLIPILSLAKGGPTPTPTPGLTGKIIALDAGHGGTSSGAVNQIDNTLVQEKDVNLAVVYELKSMLEESGAIVVLTRKGDETIDSRKDRVDMANAECNAIAQRKCDILVSVHHNGSTDSNHDGTLVIYTQKGDVPLAQKLHNSLLPLTGNDKGYLNGGYGMTVYGNLVSVITEAYYITNDSEAEQYLLGSSYITPSGYSVLVGARVTEEATAQKTGIEAYFNR